MEVVVSIFWQFYADDTAAAFNHVRAHTGDERSSRGRRTTRQLLSPAHAAFVRRKATVSCVASKEVSSVSTGPAGATTLAWLMFDLDGQRVARSARDLKSNPGWAIAVCEHSQLCPLRGSRCCASSQAKATARLMRTLPCSISSARIQFIRNVLRWRFTQAPRHLCERVGRVAA